MKNIVVALFTVAASAGFVAAQTFEVNTPQDPVVCDPTLISWNGGTGPFNLFINQGTANGPILQQYPDITGQSFTWTTNITAQTVGITVRDSTGAPAQTAPFAVSAGTSTSCLTSGGSSAPAGSTTSAAATDSSTSAGTAGTTSSGGSSVSTSVSGSSSATVTSSSGSSGTSSSSGSSPSATGGTSNGAVGNAAAMGAVGFIGAVVAAVMA